MVYARARLALRRAALVGTLLGSACGGGGSDSATPPSSPQPYQEAGLVIALATDDANTVSVWPGESATRQISLSKAVSTIRAELSLAATSSAIRLTPTADGGALTFDTANLAPGSKVGGTLIARNLDNGLSVQYPFTAEVLSPVVAASGTLPTTGGAVSSQTGLIGIQVAPGQLATPLGVTIRTATLASGGSRVQVQFGRDVSAERALVRFITNDAVSLAPAVSASKYAQATSAGDGYPLNTLLQTYRGRFLYPAGHRLANDANPLALLATALRCASGLPCIVFDLTVAAELLSDRGATLLESLRLESAAKGKNIVPILFIHGYMPGPGLGGGSGTWKDFPALVPMLAEAAGRDEIYVPFEFRWRTNASFTVVAGDLAAAIARIYNLTGSPARVVAHSFGGLLIRTLLQGRAAEQTEFDPRHVRSVLTLGTPHSGILGSASVVAGVALPRGRAPLNFNTAFIDTCNQVSCFQAGEGFFLGQSDDLVRGLTRSGEVAGGLVAELATAPVPSAAPFVIGIGLRQFDGKYVDGDGLVSYHGQRFRPESNEPLFNCGATGGPASVREVVLARSQLAGPTLPTSDAAEPGYKHNDLILSPTADRNYSEAAVTCQSPRDGECDHAAVALLVKTLREPAVYCERSSGAAPDATLLGSAVTITSDSPSLGNHVTQPYTVVVSNALELPTGAQQTLDGINLVGADIDIGARSITMLHTQEGFTAAGAFNGGVYDFGPGSPEIIGARLDPQSSFAPTQVFVGFSAHRVTISLPGLFVPQGSRVVVQLTLKR